MLNRLSNNKQVATYYIVKRYSELLTFHKLLLAELKNYMKKNGIHLENFPEFPKKKLFFNMETSFIFKRIKNLNSYFDRIF